MNSDQFQHPGTLKTVLVIARNTFREAVRDRILYNLVLFVLLITVSAIFLGELTAGHEARMIVNLGLGAVLLFGAFIAIFVGVSLVSKELEKRTVYAIFSKPISRTEFIAGKYLGLCVTLLANIIVMGVGISLALVYVKGGALVFSIWGTIFLIYLELIIITATAILFSSFSSPALSALLTFFVFIIGHFSSALRELAGSMGSGAAKFIFDAIYYLLPNLAHFEFARNAAYGTYPPPSMLAGAAAYAVVYSLVLLAITSLVFNRRDFK